MTIEYVIKKAEDAAHKAESALNTDHKQMYATISLAFSNIALVRLKEQENHLRYRKDNPSLELL